MFKSSCFMHDAMFQFLTLKTLFLLWQDEGTEPQALASIHGKIEDQLSMYKPLLSLMH